MGRMRTRTGTRTKSEAPARECAMNRIQGIGAPAALIGALALSGCGGSGPVAPESPRPEAYEPLACRGTPGVRACARDDYREAVTRDGGSLYGWGRAGMPTVWIAPEWDISYREDAVVWRAVNVINRSLPPYQKLVIKNSTGRVPGPEVGTGEWRSRLPDGHIWVGFAEKPALGDCSDAGTAGCGDVHVPGSRFARTATKGVAHVYPSEVEGAEVQVAVMVHEILHALGIAGHPQDIHTSIMSYEFTDSLSGGVDNLPLIDAAMLYELNGWGGWNQGTDWHRNTTYAGVEFGARVYDNLHVIPYVDAGSMNAPSPRNLYGIARYSGTFRGYRGASTHLDADVDINLDFRTDSGRITFSDWHEWVSSTWRRTGQSDIRYGLTLGEHWFASVGPDGDWDGNGAPDVHGGLYSHWYDSREQPDVAAGTLERGSLVGGFGGERDD